MALGISFPGDDQTVLGNIPARKCVLGLDAAYPAGGYPFTGTLIGMAPTGGLGAANNGIVGVDILGQNTASILSQLVYNAQTGNVQLITAGVEAAPGFNAAAYVFYVLALAAGA
jgi:hypothetical protein